MNLQEKLKELDAVSHGDYWIVRCPVCGHKEAFLYLDDIEKQKINSLYKIPIRCNRLNRCGKTSYLENLNIKNIPKISEDDIIGVSPFAIEKINSLAYFSNLLTDFDFNWRGISNKTLKDNGIIYLKDGLLQFMKNCGKNAFADKFFRNRCYLNRNLIFPIKDYNGNCERLLLRSTLKLGDKAKKEIGMRLKKSSSEVWNRVDLLNSNMNVVFVTEGVPDGLSIKEVSQSFGVVSLPGVRKYRQIMKELKKLDCCKEKQFVLCFDNDEAGEEYIQKLAQMLKADNYKYSFFDLHGYKDLNEFLQNDRKLFFTTVNKYKKDFKYSPTINQKFKFQHTNTSHAVKKITL